MEKYIGFCVGVAGMKYPPAEAVLCCCCRAAGVKEGVEGSKGRLDGVKGCAVGVRGFGDGLVMTDVKGGAEGWRAVRLCLLLPRGGSVEGQVFSPPTGLVL